MPCYFPIGFMNFTRFLKEPVNFRDFVTNTTKRKKKKPSWNQKRRKGRRKGGKR